MGVKNSRDRQSRFSLGLDRNRNLMGVKNRRDRHSRFSLGLDRNRNLMGVKTAGTDTAGLVLV